MVRFLRKSGVIRVLFLVLLLGALVRGPEAQARLPDPALRVGRWGLSGAVVGAAAGTVMWPISGQARTVFVGASVGLYLGIAAGLYGEWERSEYEAEAELYSATLALSERGAQALGPAPPWFSWKFRF